MNFIIIMITFNAHGPWTSLLFVRARVVVCVCVSMLVGERVCKAYTCIVSRHWDCGRCVRVCVYVLFADIVPLKILLKDLKRGII